MKVYARRSYSKISHEAGLLQKPIARGQRPLLEQEHYRNSVQVNKATDVHHDHCPTRSSGVTKMCQDMDKIRATQGAELLQKSFVVYLICVQMRGISLTWAPYKQTNKQSLTPPAPR